MIKSSLESTSTRIAVFSAYVYADISKVDIDRMSPFIPYFLHHAAIVQYGFFNTGQPDYQRNLDSLKPLLHILGNVGESQVSNRPWRRTSD